MLNTVAAECITMTTNGIMLHDHILFFSYNKTAVMLALYLIVFFQTLALTDYFKDQNH